MEKYKIELPYEDDMEKNELSHIVDGVEGAEISFKKIKGFGGGLSIAEIWVIAKETLYIVGAIASIISLLDRRATIKGSDDEILKTNIKVEEMEEYFKNTLDDDYK